MTLQPSLPKLAGMALAGLASAVGIVWIGVMVGKFTADVAFLADLAAAALAILFIVLGVCAPLWRLVMWRPVLHADERGIDVQVVATGLRHFDWEQIAAIVTYAQGFQPFVSLPQRFLGIKLHDSLAFQSRLGPLARSLVKHNKIADIWVSSVMFHGTPEAALAAIERTFADEIASHQIGIRRIGASSKHRGREHPSH